MQMPLTNEQQQLLLNHARARIEHGCRDQVYAVGRDLLQAQPELGQIASTFVTLTMPDARQKYQLRGCIGALIATQPLLLDVIEHAYSAAFRDSRFEPVTEAEAPRLHIAISIILPQEQLFFENEEQLLAQLRPGIDGLVMVSEGRRATFLPSVWEQLPDKHDFFRHLKTKAGFPEAYWHQDLQVFRYQTECFGESLS